MFTALYLLAALPLVAGLLYLLALVRIWRSNQKLAVFMLLFWPTGLYALVKYWNEKEEGVRTPLLASFAVVAVWLGFIAWGLGYQPPATAKMAEGGYDEEQEASADDGGIGAQVRRSVALANLPGSTGRVDFPTAHASIDVPAHFRFIDRDALVRAFADTGDEPGEQSIGWLVHERVDLNAKDAWHVDVDRIADGFISDDTFASQSRETLLAAARQATRTLSDQQEAGEPTFSLVGYPELPRLDPAGHSVAWVAEIAYDGKPQHVLDCTAIKLGRSGALVYSISEIDPSRRELCLRSVRLLAGRSAFEKGQTYADRSRLLDKKAGYDLVGLVTGTWAAAQPQ
jgi:uncharacterized membrane-anchored protein